MKLTFTIEIVNDAGLAGAFQLSGDDLWLNALVASISSFAVTAVHAFFGNSISRAIVNEEISWALTALMAGKEYAGKFVKVTRDEAAPKDPALEPGQ